MFARLAGNLLFWICFSVCGGGLIAAIGLLANSPRILMSLVQILRMVLRFSVQLYAVFFAWLRQPMFSISGIDLLAPAPRTMASALVSLGTGCALLAWLHWHIGFWWLAGLALHGLLVGHFWEQILNPGEFRLGERLP